VGNVRSRRQNAQEIRKGANANAWEFEKETSKEVQEGTYIKVAAE